MGSLLRKAKLIIAGIVAFVAAVLFAWARGRRVGRNIGKADEKIDAAERREQAETAEIDTAAKAGDAEALRKKILGALLVLGMSLGGAFAADPVKDCPAGLVCFSVDEAAKVAKERAAFRKQIEECAARLELSKAAPLVGWRSVVKPYWQVGITRASTFDDVTTTARGEIGLMSGPVGVGVGVFAVDGDSGAYLTVTLTQGL